MCPPVEDPQGEMVLAATLENGAPLPNQNGHGGLPSAAPRNPYAPRYSDFLSNVSNFKIIESTLRGVYDAF